MIDHLWQSTLFALVIAAMVPVFRKQGAALRFWLWFAASVKFLIPLSLLVRLGGYLPALPAPARFFAENFSAPQVIAPPAAMLPATGIVLTVWALGAVWVAARWLNRWRHLRAVMRDACAADLPSPIPVRLVAPFLEPGLVGIWRPVILLPRGIAERLSPPELEAVLAHELSHHRRRDNLLALVQMPVEMLFWFHPLVWWIGGKLIGERERACDEAVLETGHAPGSYAEGILKICRFHLQPQPPFAAGVSGGNLKARVDAIMAGRGRDAMDGQRTLLLGAVGVMTVMLPLLAGAPGTAPVNRLARQMAVVLTAPALPRLEFAAMAGKPVPRPRPVVVAALPVEAVMVEATPPAVEPLAARFVEIPPVMVAEVKPPLETDEIICRAERSSGSRLLGPSVCKPASIWGRTAAQEKRSTCQGATLAANSLPGTFCFNTMTDRAS